MHEIYQEIVRLLQAGERAALATVVRATGSTPGKESAKMLIRADGSSLGSIGGGCVEADVWALARQVMETEQPRVERFTLTPKSAEEEGLACGGIVEIFIEPIGSPTVYVFGAGHIGRSVVHLSALSGFNTVVVDDRERFANRERFPEASRIVVSEFREAFRTLRFNDSSYLVIVTRGHRCDQLVLTEALRTRAGFIGLIGSRAKVQRIFRLLAAEGVPPERLAQVKAPIGLDLGARSPEEIAVSIVAQLIAQRRRAWVKNPDRLPGYDAVRLPRAPERLEGGANGADPAESLDEDEPASVCESDE